MTYQPEFTDILESLNTSNNATQFAEIIQHNFKWWYSYLRSIIQKHEATWVYADTVVKEQTTMQTCLEKTQKQLNQFNHEGQHLQEQLSWVHTLLFTPSTSVFKSEKLSDSKLYDDKHSELQSFIASLHLKLLHNHDQFSTTSKHLTYTFSHLTGSTRNQMLLYVTATGVNFVNEEVLFAQLKLAFGDSDHKRTAQHQVQILCQRNCEFSFYFAEFNHFVQDIKYNNEVKKVMLMAELSEKLKKLLVHSNSQDISLQKLASYCQKLDNWYWANLVVLSQYAYSHNTDYVTSSINCFFINSSSTFSSPVFTSLSLSDLMNFSAAQTKSHGSLTSKEKQQHWENRLCLYCEQFNHIAVACLFKLKTALCAFFTNFSVSVMTPENSSLHDTKNSLFLD